MLVAIFLLSYLSFAVRCFRNSCAALAKNDVRQISFSFSLHSGATSPKSGT